MPAPPPYVSILVAIGGVGVLVVLLVLSWRLWNRLEEVDLEQQEQQTGRYSRHWVVRRSSSLFANLFKRRERTASPARSYDQIYSLRSSTTSRSNLTVSDTSAAKGSVLEPALTLASRVSRERKVDTSTLCEELLVPEKFECMLVLTSCSSETETNSIEQQPTVDVRTISGDVLLRVSAEEDAISSLDEDTSKSNRRTRRRLVLSTADTMYAYAEEGTEDMPLFSIYDRQGGLYAEVQAEVAQGGAKKCFVVSCVGSACLMRFYCDGSLSNVGVTDADGNYYCRSECSSADIMLRVHTGADVGFLVLSFLAVFHLGRIPLPSFPPSTESALAEVSLDSGSENDSRAADVSKTALSMTIVGMDYASLMACPLLKADVHEVIKSEIVDRMAVPADAVDVALAGGSVKVVATITSRPDEEPATDRLVGLGSAMAAKVGSVRGIGAVSHGPITVTEPRILTEPSELEKCIPPREYHGCDDEPELAVALHIL